MSGLQIICSICTDEFRDTDKITVTRCGHLFHFVCIKQWERRSRICPQCHKYKPKKYKLFLNSEDHSEALPIGGNSDNNIPELQDKLEESERNILDMQARYAVNETTMLLLRAQLSESEYLGNIQQEEYERIAVEYAEISAKITKIKELLEAIKILHNIE